MNNMPITIYLNQKIVFDLLAVIEDGFSEVRKLKTSESSEIQKSTEIQGDIGVSNVFSLIGVKLKAAFSSDSSTADSSEVTKEKVHTPTSLFSKLMTYLIQKELVYKAKNEIDMDKLKTGSFIAFKARLKQNPLISMLESFEQLGAMAIRLDSRSKKRKKKEDKEVLKQIKAMKESLQQGDMIDLICNVSNNKDMQAVLPVYINYFFNQNMNEIIDGEYTVFGKVSRIINNESSETINLFRNTGFDLFQKNAIKDLFDQMNNSAPNELDMPELNTHIEGPSLLVIPIAIFL